MMMVRRTWNGARLCSALRRTVVLCCLLSPAYAAAANHYIRSGATGANNGSDWNNAWTTFPSAYVRGDTYYVAGGRYGSLTLSTPASGATYIVLRKATDSDHGTNTGWNSSYGTAQAVLNAPLRFDSPYWVFDGATGGGPGSWTSGYGFYVRSVASTSGLKSVSVTGTHHITIRHTDTCFEDAIGGTTLQDLDNFYLRSGCSYITISHCALRHCGRNSITMWENSYITVEYCYFTRNRECLSQHAQAWQDTGTDNLVIRHNLFDDIRGTGVIVVLAIGSSGVHSDYWEIYGNSFRRGTREYDGSDAIICVINDQVATGWKVYNNTFDSIYILGGRGTVFATNEAAASGGGHQVYNNLIYNVNYPLIAFNSADRTSVRDFNHYRSCTGTIPSEPHGTLGAGDPFTARTILDYRPTLTVGAGTTLASPYNTDGYGRIRGADGTWDCGACEFSSGEEPAPPPPPPVGVRLDF